jgi:preprotein translocase subunit YajC
MDEMTLSMVKPVLTQGPFAILFVILLFHVMKKNEQREAKLHELLDKFSEKYDVIIAELRDIKNKVDK